MDTALTHTQSQAAETLQGIMALEKALLTLPQDTLELKHWFPNGMYARLGTMPAGAVMTGAVHLTEHLCAVMQGKVSVVSSDGSSQVYTAPAVFISPAGAKRALYALEDTVWLNVHRCEARTIEGAEDELVTNADTMEEYLQITASLEKPLCLESH